MEEILDPLEHQMLQYLPVSDFLKLCQTNTTFAKFCDNPETWTYFVRRDFDPYYRGEFPREDYFIKQKIKNWRKLLFLDSEEAYWEMLDIVRYGGVPDPDIHSISSELYIVFETKENIGALRIIKLLDSLNERELDKLEEMYSRRDNLANSLIGPIRRITGASHIFAAGRGFHLANLSMQDRNLYENLKNHGSRDDVIEKHLYDKILPTSPIFKFFKCFGNDPLCPFDITPIVTLPSNDPILRNL